MTTAGYLGPEDCNCLAVRQAARHITQFYDQLLAPSGLTSGSSARAMRRKRMGRHRGCDRAVVIPANLDSG